VAATQTLDAELTRGTLKHFAACIVCFYLGWLSLGPTVRIGWFWLGLLCGFALVLAVGWEQRFGGLQATRDYFYLYIYPTMKEIPPGYLKRINSDRVFATLFYPNALAGLLLLMLPVALGVTQSISRYLTKPALRFVQTLVCIFSLGCLFFSGSKGGWLLMLLLGVITLTALPFSKRFKLVFAGGLLLMGLGGFFWKYSGFFQKGATSVGARMDYWQAALSTTMKHPLFGTGPGTFVIPYQAIKRPESELARLVHNDYLEQASDSGIVGFLTYSAFWVSGMTLIFRRMNVWTILGGKGVHLEKRTEVPQPGSLPLERGKGGKPALQMTFDGRGDEQTWLMLGIWLGLLGWGLHALIEFPLYIPGSAWPALALMGWLCRYAISTNEAV
jgi:O-antigen ligase